MFKALLDFLALHNVFNRSFIDVSAVVSCLAASSAWALVA